MAITPDEYDSLVPFQPLLRMGNWHPLANEYDLVNREHLTNPDLSRDDIIEIAVC